MLRGLADHAHDPASFDDQAFVTNFFNGCSNFHVFNIKASLRYAYL